MVFTKAVDVIQSFLEAIKHQAHGEAKIWVDGLWIAEAANEVRAALKSYGCTFRTEQKRNETIEFDGFVANHKTKTLTLTEGFSTKLSVAFTALKKAVPWRVARAAFGRVVHAVTLLKIPCFDALYLFKWYRKQCAKDPPPPTPQTRYGQEH